MIHMKSLIRRLDCVPWLLTAGLVLGLVGVEEAVAQQVRLTLDTYEVNERAGKDGAGVDIVVTAKLYASDAADGALQKVHCKRVRGIGCYASERGSLLHRVGSSDDSEGQGHGDENDHYLPRSR